MKTNTLGSGIEFSTWIDVLRSRASDNPSARAYTFLVDGDHEGVHLTYGELDARARSIGALLQEHGARGERALLLYPPGIEYIEAFFGCLYAGAVAVPAYPPRLNRSLPRLRSILEDARPRIALTTSAILNRVEGWREQEPWLGAIPWLEIGSLALKGVADWEDPGAGEDTLAFLQYTSGSTGTPKGVMLSHGNLLHNSRELRRCFGYSTESRSMVWLPPYHDMGLIGGILQPLHGGFPATLMAPVAFLQNPRRWLAAISRDRATISGGPDFAYDLCVRRIPAAEREALDLSSWEVAFSGAEPVRAATLERFAEAFAPCGFRSQAFYPCYGLAEATLIASGGPVFAGAVERVFDAGALDSHQAVLAVEGKRLVGNGQCLTGQRLAIVDPEASISCPPGVVGEVWVAGPSVAQGYWNRPEETGATFGARLPGGDGPYLRTGDLGFLDGGELFITGRLKDLIIIRGRNHYPQDVEATAEAAHPSLRPGCSAAFSVEVEREERLVVVAEIERTVKGDLERVAEAVRQAVAQEHEVQVREVVLIRVATLPKTSSGKIQRRACRSGYLAGELMVVGRSSVQKVAGAGDWITTRLVRADLSLLPLRGRADALLPFLRQEAARALRLSPWRIEPDLPLAAYGLDSLSAVELKSRLDTSFEIELPLDRLLEGTSLGQIADEILARLEAPPTASERIGVPRVIELPGATGEGRPSMGQRALWLLERLSPGSGANHIVAAARIRSSVDVPALRRTFSTLLERHPALRTTFAEVHGEPVLRVHERMEIEILEQDASPETLDARMVEAAWRPFDLERGPLLRVVLFPWAPTENGERVLLLAVHHIVSDFWSLAVLARELGRLYAAELAGRPAVLDPPVLDFRDWIAWQEERLAGPEAERLWSYWLEQLAGELPHLDLPADRPRPPVQSHRGGSRSLVLAADLVERLRRFSREREATLYVTLLAVFQTLLHRYTGQEDLLVGSPTSGRPTAEVERVVGYFVNPVVLRADFSAVWTLDDVLVRTRRTVLGALAHAELPLALLAERLQPARDPSRPVLFQVMFVLQKARDAEDEALAAFALGVEGTRMDLGGLAVEPWPFEQRRSQFDLTLVTAETAGGLGISLQYNADLFDASTMVRLAGHYANLLAGIVAGARAWRTGIHDLPLLSPAELEQVLRRWNDTGPAPPADLCLHELFEAQAKRTPGATALVFGLDRFTYAELDGLASRWARRLARLGVGPEVPVGICAERTPEMVVGMLGVLKAGGAYVPLDPNYPAQRLAWILDDLQDGVETPVVLTQRRLLPKLEGMAARTVCLDEAWDGQDGQDIGGEAEPRPADLGNLAYVIYTSGSTGRPKGVAIEHRTAAALVPWSREVFPDREMAGVLAATSINFDLSVFELWVTLARGGKVILASNALELPSLPARDEVTLVDTVPSAMAELVRGGGIPASVLTVNLAGEALTRTLVDGIYEAGAVERVLNLYGPSEDTTFSTFVCVPRGERRAPTIGRPLAGTQAFVLGRRLEPVPRGVAGQLHLGGAGISRGYLNRPELTAERYVPNPFGPPGARMYKTGDLVRYLSDGQLDYLGRIDHQVKVRGFRIELGEIEAALAAHQGVEEAAVLAREDRPGDRRLAAYVVTRSGLAPASLRAHLRERLPEFMIPSDFVLLEALPRTPNGKLDRKALPVPGRAVAGSREAAWGTAIEELLAEIWAELLGVERVGPEDNFFAAGGHSLMAARLVARVRDLLGAELPLAAVFESPTLAGLAGQVERIRRGTLGLVGAPPLLPVPRGAGIPPSYAQERLWFLDRMEPAGAAYNMPFVARLDGPLDVAAFGRALDGIVQRHEVLRTAFVAGEDGRVVQVVSPPGLPGRPALSVIDLSGLAVPWEESRTWLAAEARRPFDLARGPLLRTVLFRLGAESHLALVVQHHIVSDGWSVGVFLRELAALYGGSPLPGLPVQYADYAVWQRSWLESGVLEAQLAYWRERLRGAPQALDLPTDRPRPPVQAFRGGERSVLLPGGLARDLLALGRREGATPFMVLLAGFQALLQRYSGQDDLLVGSPIAGRGRSELQPMIGFFVNTLVLRGDLAGDPGFAELLARVRGTSLGAYTHQDLPFERLVEELRPKRDLSRPPLFQVMLTHQGMPFEIPDLSGIAVSPLPLASGTAKFDLTLALAEETAGLAASLEYDASLFDGATALRLLGSFAVLLAAAVADPCRPLAALPLLAEAERQQLLEWNESEPPAAADCLHELFEAQAKRTPGATALVFGLDRFTYAELDGLASRWARRLARLGVGPEVTVGICAERTPEMVVGMLGVLKAGGAYVPLDPNYPAQRLAWILDDLQDGVETPVVLTQRRLLPKLEGMAARTVCLDEVWDGADRGGEAEPRPADLGNLAYVIYTSGSTGRPKGVAIEHRTAAALVPWSREVFPDREMAGVLAATSINFDLSVFELWVTLARGGKVILAANALELPSLPARDEVTLVDTVPSAMAELVRGGGIPASVLTVNLAGEALSRPLVEGVYDAGAVERVLNLYGPSEDTTFSTFVCVPRGERRAPTIGRPLAGTQAYVLDGRLRPMPIGVPGELYLGGAGISRGYLNRPELTAERYVPDPFGPPGTRMYKTGDLTRWLPDGELEYLGRIDHQVKVRGFRVELGEVEAALAAHEALAEAVVVAREDRSGDLRLVAYVVPEGVTVPAAELRRFLQARLPEFMIPSALVTLSALPLSPNGKVDRQALPGPDEAGAGPASGFAAPRTPEEELLAGIWSELLGVERVGIDDDFFELGGHSLLATRVVSLVRQALGVELPLQALFGAPTLAALAAVVAAARAARGSAELESLPPPLALVPRNGPLPLSFGQERLWFLDRLEPGSGAFNIPAAARLKGRFQKAAFDRSLSGIVRRHEALRTTFGMEQGRPVQVIAPAEPVAVPLTDLSGLPAGPRSAEVQRLAREEAVRPFDLARGPLLRGALLRLEPEEHVALVTMHHIVSDGWSIGVLLGELSAFYGALAAGEEPALPELPIQYADYAAWQREWLRGGVLAGHLDWWREGLAGAPTALALPTDRPRPAVGSMRGASLPVAYATDLSRALAALGRRHGATLFMTLLAAFQALLARLSGQERLVVGSPVANRSRLETEGLIGFFLNTLPLAGDLSGDPGFPELLGRVRDMALGAYAHQDLPFEKLVTELAPERNLSHAPIFQVLLVLQNASLPRLELPGLTVEQVEVDSDSAKLDLVLNLTDTGRGLAGRWLYKTDLFDRTTSLRFAGHFQTLLEGIAAAPERRLSELPLLSAVEAQQLREWNATAAAYRSACLHELIGEQAERTPGATAVSFEGEELDYRRLDRLANALARRLAALGVGPEVRVGIAAERSLELVVGLLAILKAGGAYVPLDSSYPRERLAWLLEDSRVEVLLTQERLAAALPAQGARVMLLDGAAGEGAAEAGVPPASGAGPDNLAYVIYTSGSTGRPKGAMNTHRGIVNRLLWMQERYGIGPDDRVLQKTPVSFDVSVWELFWPLLAGARLVMARPGSHGDSAYLVETIAAHGITTLHFVPSMLQAFAEAPGLERCGSLRRVIASGEALPRDLQDRFLERSGASLDNLYGPTEAAVDVTYWACERGPRLAVPIGRPVANTAIHVLDRALRPVPAGAAGELYIGGAQVGRGYWQRPELTAERFVPDPFAPAPGARLYRTGDLARFACDGAVEYLGRLDHQVKIRGFRIELGEIEAALADLPGVREAVVLALAGAAAASGGAAGDRRLVAYVTPEDLSAATLRAALLARLPEHMVPSAFVPLAAMPLSPNGKADRQVLARLWPGPGEGEAGSGYAPPATALEEDLSGLWREAAGVARVGIHDSFFDLGGSSISAAILINRLQEKLGEIVHVVAIFDHPTVAGFAAYLARDYPRAVARVWGAESPGEKGGAAGPGGQIGEERIALLRSIVTPVSWRPAPLKNPPAVFVLSPPRSGSTLLRVMLAGHPRLFAPPELELLTFAGMAERRAAFSGRESFWLEGLLRAVMEVRRCGAQQAAEILAACEREALSTQEFCRRLQGWLGERLLVDKTPSYALDPALLERLEETFQEPRYLHLLRHPHGMIRSFEEARLEQVFFRYPHPFTRRELAELVWLVSHENVTRFLAGVPAGRHLQVRFEDLVRDPEGELKAICDFLGIEYHPAMADPYQDGGARMTDGVHAESRMLGDVKFHRHDRVDAGVAERWREELAEDFLGEPARRLAVALGYENGGGDWTTIPRLARPPGEPFPLSFAQERLWFLDQLDPGSPAYNIPAAFHLRGRLSVPALAVAMAGTARRHESLRTTLVQRDGRPVQIVKPPGSVPLPLIDLRTLPAAPRRVEAERLRRQEAARPFDLAAGPLARHTLLCLGDEDWVALLTLHHVIADGWSMGIFIRELAALYAAALEGRLSPLPELPVQYADYAVWQRERLAGRALESQVAWWRERLRAAPAALELPTDRPRPPVQSLRGAERAFALTPELSRQLRDLSRREGATLFMTVLAAFQALLGRLSGQPDVLVGSPVANRNRAEIEGLIGVFINTLVFAGDLEGDPDFRELLVRSRRASLDAFAHAEVPYERLVEELRPRRDLSRPPLFQVMLVYQNTPSEAPALPGLTLSPLRAASGTSKFELNLAVVERGEGEAWRLAGSLEYSAELFDPATAQRLLGQLETLLEGVAADPGRRLADLPLLSAAERQQLELEWATGGPLGGEGAGACLHELFEAQVRRTPEALALVAGAERLTYRELDRRAGRLAGRLQILGAGPERLVGVCLERSADLAIALLAVLKAGSAYVPLDPAYPVERLAFLAADSGVAVLVARPGALAALPGLGWGGTTLSPAPEPGAGDEDAGAVRPAVLPGNLAYLIYTSGSTGVPKGVAIEHRSAAALVRWALEAFPPAVFAGTLASTSMAFDLSVFELFVPLSCGGTVVLADNALALPAAAEAAREAGVEVTLVNTVPSAIAELVRLAALPASVRTVNLAGEPLKRPLADRVYGELGVERVFNLYGPSEDTTYSTFTRVPRDTSQAPTIGRPIAGTKAYVLDGRLGPAPAGVPGELYLGGQGLARGYLGRPDLTAERFVPDPLGEPGARLYHSGDLARWRADGELEFLGRRDSQVKLRGFRIELGEIEERLGRHPGVREAAVVAREDGDEMRLLAYVVPGVEPAPTAGELRAFLRTSLPEHMVPSAFVPLAALPLTPNGKVDRHALPAPGAAGAERQAYVAPRTVTEELLAGIWAEVLKVERVGARDNFFDLGGHSLLGAQMISRIRQAAELDLPLRALFQNPTVEGLAEALEDLLVAEEGETP